jgi:hypothetical protein
MIMCIVSAVPVVVLGQAKRLRLLNNMKHTTNEFSFKIKSSTHGIGVFAMHNIAKGTHLHVSGDDDETITGFKKRKLKDVPAVFRDLCIYQKNKTLLCPDDFGRMNLGWYLNHSITPNAAHNDFVWYAARDIKANEEILIDYNTLGEPVEERDTFYKK